MTWLQSAPRRNLPPPPRNIIHGLYHVAYVYVQAGLQYWKDQSRTKEMENFEPNAPRLWIVVKLRSDQIMAMSVVCSFLLIPLWLVTAVNSVLFWAGFGRPFQPVHCSAISRSTLRSRSLDFQLAPLSFPFRSHALAITLVTFLQRSKFFYREELAEEPFCRYYAIHRSSSTITIKAGVKLRNYYFASFWKLKKLRIEHSWSTTR